MKQVVVIQQALYLTVAPVLRLMVALQRFIFAGADGVISGWTGGTTAVRKSE
jgi:hypothetical protein